ncbi:MAG: ribonuclease Y [Clostridia bacterium]|nr:ribonuclease Y [Clostridia bacterium]
MYYAIIAIVAVIIGGAAGFLYRKNVAEAKVKKAEDAVKLMIDEATIKAKAMRKETILEAKEEVHKMRSDLEKETKERRGELQKTEKRLVQKEETLDKKLESINQREEELNEELKKIEKKRNEADEYFQKQLTELEKISGLTREEAKEIFLQNIEKDSRADAALLVRQIEAEAKEEADKKARNIVCLAIQRCAADQVSEATVSVVALPNDEMKGRIIGREGRNIRAIESATGVDLIIDDTPEAVILSSFDPIRREIARISLEKLILDGRIHPAGIEEMVAKVRKEIEQQIKEAGEQALFDTGIHGVHPEIVKLLGRLKFRTSYGQNVLNHSVEVSRLAGAMAAEVGANVAIAKRGGLLHDIGKGMDFEMEGSHVQIGVDYAKRYKESKEVIHTIEAHHNDVEMETVEAMLVQAADAISAARPGARMETLKNYIKRLESLEAIASSFEGVENSYAIQAGREVRIAVVPEKVDDAQMTLLAKDICKKIESEMEYPGQIKVNIIRETRATDFAK